MNPAATVGLWAAVIVVCLVLAGVLAVVVAVVVTHEPAPPERPGTDDQWSTAPAVRSEQVLHEAAEARQKAREEARRVQAK